MTECAIGSVAIRKSPTPKTGFKYETRIERSPEPLTQSELLELRLKHKDSLCTIYVDFFVYTHFHIEFASL